MRKLDPLHFTRATRETSRAINRQIALNLIREHQPISRADLARRLELNRGSVTFLVNELIQEGAVVEGETRSSPRGRRPKMLYVRTRDRLVVGVDVRFSRTYLMLSDLSGREIAFDSVETPLDPDKLVLLVGERVRDLARRHASLGAVEGVGVVIPGMVDQASGRVLFAPQLRWRDVPIRDALVAACGLPVSLEHASVACALAQMWLGEPETSAASDFVYVTVSDGVGAAVVANGQVMRGASGSAGEFGHVPIDPSGPRCVCGSAGCWEVYASNMATLARYLGRQVSLDETREMLREQELSMEGLVRRARQGEPRAREALLQTGHFLGVGLAVIVNTVNPARIVVGGEITGAWELVEGAMQRIVRERALTPAAAFTPILPDRTFAHPRLRGATALLAAPMYALPTFA